MKLGNFSVAVCLLVPGLAYVIRTADGLDDVQKVTKEDGIDGVAFLKREHLLQTLYFEQELTFEEQTKMPTRHDEEEEEDPARANHPAFVANAVLLV